MDKTLVALWLCLVFTAASAEPIAFAWDAPAWHNPLIYELQTARVGDANCTDPVSWESAVFAGTTATLDLSPGLLSTCVRAIDADNPPITSDWSQPLSFTVLSPFSEITITATEHEPMATIIVKEDGSEDYTTLDEAIDNALANDIIEIQGAWANADTKITSTITVDNLTIRTVGEARHPGYVSSTPTYYRLETTSTNVLTVAGNNLLVDGLVIKADRTITQYAIAIYNGVGITFTSRNNIIYANDTRYDSQIGIYISNSDATINVEQTQIYNFSKGGIYYDDWSVANTIVFNINSSTLWNNARDGEPSSRPGGIFGRVVNGSSITFNIHNSIVITENLAAAASDFAESISSGTVTWNISNSIDSDGSIAALGPDAGNGSLGNRTATDSDTPGVGDWVVFNDITTYPYDLRLKDNAENDAQDMHATATAHSLTIPSTDIVGTSRPQDTNYDCGAFEIVSGGGPTVISVSDSGAGSDALANLLAGLGISDAGSGNDALPNLLAGLGISDAGSGNDALPNLLAGLGISDAGSGTDTPTIAVQLTVIDTGSGLDEIALLQAILKTVTDAVSGIDAVGAITATMTLVDTGDGVETPTIAVQLGVADTSAATDLVQALAQISLTESGVGGDLLSGIEAQVSIVENGSGVDTPGPLQALVPVPESATGVDSTPTITATLTITDSGAGLDDVSVLLGGILKSIADTGLGTDSITGIQVHAGVSDSATGIDTPGVQVTIGITDTSAGTDDVNLLIGLILKTVTDQATAGDSLPGVIAQLNIGDSGIGSDGSPTLAVKALVSDSGIGTDQVLSIAVHLALSESGAGVELLDTLAVHMKVITDSAVGVEQVNVAVQVSIPDSSMGVDGIGALQALLALSDAANGTDVVLRYDATIRIASLSFTLAHNLIRFDLAQPEIRFSLD